MLRRLTTAICSFQERKGEVSKRLGVIFITNSGKETEKILGLITAWDLGKIEDK